MWRAGTFAAATAPKQRPADESLPGTARVARLLAALAPGRQPGRPAAMIFGPRLSARQTVLTDEGAVGFAQDLNVFLQRRDRSVLLHDVELDFGEAFAEVDDDGMLIEQRWTNRWSLCSEPAFQGLHFLLQFPVALFSRREFGEQAVPGDSVFRT